VLRRLLVVAALCVPLGLLGPEGSLESVGVGGGPGGSGAGPARVVLALGDSVPSGAACGCDPFPQTYGSLLSRRTGAEVTVDNRAVGGIDTAELIDQLRTTPVQDAVRRSDIILVTIGANDFGDHHDDVVTGTCPNAGDDCVADEVAALRSNLTSVLTTLHTLRDGRPTAILVTGYWNVFEDGAVAQDRFGAVGLDAALRLTRRANAVIRTVATAEHATYVDLFAPFQQGGRDITSLMASDGDHPDAAGHLLIAETLLDAGTPGLS